MNDLERAALDWYQAKRDLFDYYNHEDYKFDPKKPLDPIANQLLIALGNGEHALSVVCKKWRNENG